MALSFETDQDGGSAMRLLDQLPDPALWVDRDARVVAANAHAARLLELPTEHLVGRPLGSCWLEDDAAPLLHRIRRDVPPAPPELFEARTLGGRPCCLAPALVRDVRPDATLLILRDAGERAREGARSRMITTAAEQVSEGMAILDRRGGETELVWANPACYALLGFEEGPLAPAEQVAERFRSAFAQLHPERRGQEEGPVAGRGTLERADGTRISVRYALRPIREGSVPGVRSGWVCTFVDTTEQDRLDRMLQEQQAVNRDARDMAALGDMVAGIAHDFNNSITVIRNLALLSSGEEDLTRIRDDLASIMQASEDAAELARSLTAFGRRGARQDREEVFDFDETVGQIVQVVGRGLRMKLEIETDLACGARIRSRPGMLQQVLYNLMINAGDAVKEHGTLVVRTRRICEEGEERVELTVQDDGAGMPESVRERAFVPYFTTKGSAGTGLGLAKVQYMLHQNRGTIRLDSRPGEGTTFVIGLPVEPVAPGEAHADTTLLVDDDPVIRELLPKILERRGVRCATAASGAAADALRPAAAPALVIVDLVLGQEDGRDVARALRQRWRGARFVLTTGAELPDRSDPPAPFDYVLAKPFAPADVDAMLAYFAVPEGVPSAPEDP